MNFYDRNDDWQKMIKNKQYVIFMLLLVSIFNFTDHMIFSLLMEPIKIDLSLSDTQLGLLSGLAFAIFYCLLGLPIARWADRGNRVTIISIAIITWSGMTALCGLATNFVQILFCRIGVGAGEAGCTPPSHSLISDYYSRAERPKAMSFFMMGAPLGILVGYLLGGWINELYGWRTAFISLGIPGVVIGFLVKSTVMDPRTSKRSRHELGSYMDEKPELPPITNVVSALLGNTTFLHLAAALALMYFVGYGIGQWQPAYFIRVHGMQSGELGIWLAISGGLGGAIGV